MAKRKYFTHAGKVTDYSLGAYDVASNQSKIDISDSQLIDFAQKHNLTTMFRCALCGHFHKTFETMRKCLLKLYSQLEIEVKPEIRNKKGN